jgi:hypothetical protein
MLTVGSSLPSICKGNSREEQRHNFYLFLFYLMILSVAQYTERRLVRRLMNNEWETVS